MSGAPRLSVVVTTRNDDHGGDLLRRMQIFVDGFLQQARRHGLDSELIIVEWNPPLSRPRLAEALRWPEEADACRVRIIEVSAEIHRRYRYADRLNLYQMIAKNVGIRRSLGQFVLCTNVDLLFSDALVQFLAAGPLDRDAMYRIDRIDVSPDVPVGVPLGEQLEFCRQHVVRVCTRWGTFLPGQIQWLAALRPTAGMMLARGLTMARGVLRRANSLAYRIRSLRAQGALLTTMLAFVEGLSTRWHRRLRLDAPDLKGMTQRYFEWVTSALTGAWRSMTRPLHTNGCGDFTLLSRERWFALRGYPELDMFSLHLDSVLCQMAAVAGAREVLLGDEMRLYHMDHGSGWASGEADALVHRMNALGVPILESGQYRVWAGEAMLRRAPIIFNGANWGLVRERLNEIDPIGRGRDHSLPEHVTA